MTDWAIEIDRSDIRHAWLIDEDAADPAQGQVTFAVSLVALTANNITYAALGEPIGLLGEDAGYWDFYAARGAPGRLPVWGFARVVHSRAEGIAPGEEFYGYWPLASQALLTPARIGPAGFGDATPQRQKLPALYNNYQRVAALEDHHTADHDLWPIWRPLQVTGWLVADQLEDEGDHGAEQVLVTAASSKTALAFAHAMRRRAARPRLIALTSARSAPFVQATGLYDAVIDYDAIATIDGAPAALIDFANDPAIVAAVRQALGTKLVFDLIVGFTHWDSGTAGGVDGVPRAGFFAPSRLTKRGADWGGDRLRTRMGEAWRAFIADAAGLAAIDARHGGEAALAGYRALVAGEATPGAALLLRP